MANFEHLKHGFRTAHDYEKAPYLMKYKRGDWQCEERASDWQDLCARMTAVMSRPDVHGVMIVKREEPRT